MKLQTMLNFCSFCGCPINECIGNKCGCPNSGGKRKC
jgi:hypothetical protein